MNNEPNIQHSPGSEFSTRIVDAARRRFEQFGFAKTSMQEIARACDMSAANLYRFYEGKLAIGSAVAFREQETQLSACDQAVNAAGSDVTDRLVALFQTNIDATRKKMKRTPLLFELGMIVAREEKELRRQFLHGIERRILAILVEGFPASSAFESAAIKLHSRMILMACAPFVLPWMLLNEPFGNPRAMVGPLIRLLVPGLLDDSTEFFPTNASALPENAARSRLRRRMR